MAELTVQARDADITEEFSAPEAGGDSFRNDGFTELHVINPTDTDITVTVTAQGRCKFGFLHDEVETVEANGIERLGPYETSRFNDRTTGLLHFVVSDPTDIEVVPQRQR